MSWFVSAFQIMHLEATKQLLPIAKSGSSTLINIKSYDDIQVALTERIKKKVILIEF